MQWKSQLYIPRKGMARPQSQFPQSCVCERFIHSHDRSAAGKYVDRSWEYIYKSLTQTHECGNWDWGRTIPFLGIHKWDFHCSVVLWIRIHWIHFQDQDPDCFLSPDSAPGFFYSQKIKLLPQLEFFFFYFYQKQFYFFPTIMTARESFKSTWGNIQLLENMALLFFFFLAQLCSGLDSLTYFTPDPDY